MLKRLALLLPALAATAALAACSGNDSSDASSSGDGASTATAPLTSSSAPAVTCTYTPGGTAARKVSLPPSMPAYTGQVPVTIHTSVGDLQLTLDADKAPCTVNSFLSLAKQGYFDNTHCHRMADSGGFQFLQCGDPTGTGSGTPGYSFDDELTGDETYPAGTVAMANLGQPNTNGSQFFLVYGDTSLNPDYTVFGTMDDATVKTLKKVAAAGIANPSPEDGTGEPKDKVKFLSVTIG